MPRITKGMIEAAKAELECIHELACDPDAFNGKHATYMHHARSANNYLAVLVKAHVALPSWIVAGGEKYFRAMGWHW